MTTVEPTLDDLHDIQATALEEAAVAAVVDEFADDVGGAVGKILAARATLAAVVGVTDRGALPVSAAEQLTAVAVRAIEQITPRLRIELTRTAAAGFDLGATHAAEVVDAGDLAMEALPEAAQDSDDIDTPAHDDDLEPDDDPTDWDDVEPELPDWLTDDDALLDVIDTAEDRAQAHLDAAVDLARTLPMDSEADVNAVAAKATTAVNGARRDAAWVAERSASAGVAAETERVAADPTVDGEPGLLWLSERDGCLACLALSGQVAAAGDLFPDVTFADHPLDLDPVPYPPRHPHCRCRVRPYDGPPPTDDMSADDPASALAREARRSVLRGWSASDTEPARLRAADRLVQQGANLPASVVARALRNLADGEFSQRQRPRTDLRA